ncbi:hypothetical protein FNF29_01628 [Cafeteria roenbergensis]|uniref:SAF domain-containing protein n=1 Tax=Cafeteria roenbergensis TaxID=33653 RepID=A0A5A8CRL7_CAFRO|nr:hypothetical protein FNF29_01628 [Cafeteria roenbergensis]|eukprot:KAA0155713.1 hypothetical protein FNF29_01628 [Cafeteria roenbergensis]
MPSGRALRLDFTVLEGHRFAAHAIEAGELLTSWGSGFGRATRRINEGSYVVNATMLHSLEMRRVPFELPPRVNFEDFITPYTFSEADVRVGDQVGRLAASEVPSGTATFWGFLRPGGRGSGTRNFVAVIPTTSRTSALARLSAKALRERLSSESGALVGSLSGVEPIEHTEAGGDATVEPTNLDLVIRVLAGLAVHCNVGAVVVLSRGDEALSCDRLEAAMREQGYPLDHVPHAFVTVGSAGVSSAIEQVVAAGEPLARAASLAVRTERPASELCVALQCGGSDAFSGVSGNPLAGAVARELIRRGGSAVLAETDELIGAESWVLSKVRSAAVARRFVEMVSEFRERLGWHSQTVEANPSVGNNYRGLYNIALKSLGAATKKPADVRLDDVIEYGQRVAAEGDEEGSGRGGSSRGGYIFMNSPGNDIESIAGQVAAGCNIIFFTTGNGSITNFPLVPTCKIVTNTGRFSRLAADMDVNAGAYLDGTPMETLTDQVLRLTLAVSSGRGTAGERTGRSQVSIWRAWPQTSAEGYAAAAAAPEPTGAAISLAPLLPRLARAPGEAPAALPGALTAADPDAKPSASGVSAAGPSFSALRSSGPPGTTAWVADRIALVLPTSLCSGQVAQLVVDRLNDRLARERASGSATAAGSASKAVSWGPASPDPADEALPSPPLSPAAPAAAAPSLARHVTRFVALPHTEGCGSSGPMAEYFASMAGHLLHPGVWRGALLEHGCEKLHNDEMRAAVRAAGRSEDDFGWVSVQLDGGIEAVSAKIEKWFEGQCAEEQLATDALGSGAAPLDETAPALLSTAVLAVATAGPVALPAASLLCQAIRQAVINGGSVVVPETSELLEAPCFQDMLEGEGQKLAPTIAFGQRVLGCGEAWDTPGKGGPDRLAGAASRGDVVDGVLRPAGGGLHIMACPTTDWAETLTGLVSCGSQAVIAHARRPVTGHPVVPVFVMASSREECADADAVVGESEAVATPEALLGTVCSVLSRTLQPVASRTGNTGWQITRGKFCVSV